MRCILWWEMAIRQAKRRIQPIEVLIQPVRDRRSSYFDFIMLLIKNLDGEEFQIQEYVVKDGRSMRTL